MPTTRAKKSPGGISDEAVKKATGCDWKSWIWHLDKAGCAEMEHKEIAGLVYKRWPKIGGWWSQMVSLAWTAILHPSTKSASRPKRTAFC